MLTSLTQTDHRDMRRGCDHSGGGGGRDMDLDIFLSPRSVAVVGASRNPKKLGHVILKHVMEGDADVYPVNPNAEEIEGLTCYPSVTDIPADVDLAVLAIPAQLTPVVVKECCRKKVKGVIPIAGGFGETGTEGKKLEREITSYLKNSSTRVLGPNTIGIYSPRTKLDTLFLVKERAPRPKEGPIALISQSGAMGATFIDYMSFLGLGLSAFVGLGNRLDLSENEFIEYFAHDPHTKTIVVYLESFADGREFYRICKEVNKKRPVVCLKAGRTERGARAASLHTGALGGAEPIANGALRQAGVTRAYDERELIDYAQVMACCEPINGQKIATLTCGGGAGVISVDLLTSTAHGYGLDLSTLSEGTKKELRSVVPPYASVENPVDLTGSATNEMYQDCLQILQGASEVDGILCLLLAQIPGVDERFVDMVVPIVKEGRRPTVFAVVGGAFAQHMLVSLNKLEMAAYPSIVRGIKAIRVLVDRGEYLQLDAPHGREIGNKREEDKREEV